MKKFPANLAVILLLVLGWSMPAFGQASGDVKVRFAKAGLVAGAGGGSGVLTYRGRSYRFSVTGLSVGFTAGASVMHLEGRANGLREVSDFAGRYSSVGGGGALVAGVGGVHLENEKGVRLELRGPRAGLEFAANLGTVNIALQP